VAAAVQLRDDVFLIAAVVGRKDDFLGRARPVVGDVEEGTNLVD